MKPSEPYPLLTERQLVYRLWGGKRILEWLNLPDPSVEQTVEQTVERIGESWEVFDTNIVRNGPLVGQTLAQATQHYAERLVGTRIVERYGADFCLLIKFIDTNDKISIQVHPDDAYAHTHEAETGFHGKTEAWHILDTHPDAGIIYGLKDRITREQFVQLVETEMLVPCVQHIPVAKGDTTLIPPGIIHGMDAGLLLYEVQQKSDLTYRVYDYGRRDPATGTLRELHLQKALDILHYEPEPVPKTVPLPLDASGERTLLVACRHFALERWRVQRKRSFDTNRGTMEILTIIDGQSTLEWAGGTMDLKTGDSVIVPAALGAAHLVSPSAPCHLLRVYVPDLEHDIRKPLQERGWTLARIAQAVFDV